MNQSSNMLAKYTQGQGIDQPLSELRSGAISYYEQDGLGSVTSLSGVGGTLTNTYGYDSFGNVTNSSGSAANPYQYTGRDYDPETGLRYYRARYYDPSTGRFLSEDPIGSFSTKPNFYLYGKNEPNLFKDPSGLEETPQQIFQDAENEALRRLKDPNCAKAFKGKGPCKIKETHYRRKPANTYRDPWVASTLNSTLVYINESSVFYNYKLGDIYKYVDPTQPNTAYMVPAGPVWNAMALLHELVHELKLDVIDVTANGATDSLAALANTLYVLQNCFSDLRVPLP